MKTTDKAVLYMARTKTTQTQLAAMLNVSPRTVWASLHGRREWSDNEKKTIDELFKKPTL